MSPNTPNQRTLSAILWCRYGRPLSAACWCWHSAVRCCPDISLLLSLSAAISGRGAAALRPTRAVRAPAALQAPDWAQTYSTREETVLQTGHTRDGRTSLDYRTDTNTVAAVNVVRRVTWTMYSSCSDHLTYRVNELKKQVKAEIMKRQTVKGQSPLNVTLSSLPVCHIF